MRRSPTLAKQQCWKRMIFKSMKPFIILFLTYIRAYAIFSIDAPSVKLLKIDDIIQFRV